jgi:hypothetical protein
VLARFKYDQGMLELTDQGLIFRARIRLTAVWSVSAVHYSNSLMLLCTVYSVPLSICGLCYRAVEAWPFRPVYLPF